MNEAWADYFASVSCGITNFLGDTYNHAPGRTISNNYTCQDRIGEVHTDGSIFAGGLIQVRVLATALNVTTEFDRIVLSAMMTAGPQETFADQYTTILTLLQTSPNQALKSLTGSAQTIFDIRDLKCRRVTPYDETLDTNFVLNAGSPITPVSTLSNQFLFQPFVSDWSISLTWNQYVSDNFLGNLASGVASNEDISEFFN